MQLRLAVLALTVWAVQAAAQNEPILAGGEGSALPGSIATVPLTLTTQGADIAGLQFDVPKPSADVESISARLGPAARDANKAITCSLFVDPDTQQLTDTTRCLIIDPTGQALIGDGVVAELLVSTLSTFAVATPVALTGALGTSSAGDPVTLVTQDGNIVPGTGPCDLDGDGQTSVVDVQRIINAALSGECKTQ